MTIALRNEEVQAAIDYLAKNVSAAAKAKAEVLRTDYERKRTRARLILEAEGTVQMREAGAECHEDYVKACAAHTRAVEEFERHANERHRAEHLIEVWQTLQASNRGLGKAA